MEWNQGSYKRPSRNVFKASGFFTGLLGVIIGALLVYGLFAWGLLPFPEDETLPEDQDADNKLEESSPSPGTDPAAVEVVTQVMPAVVGVNRYVMVNRFGQQTLIQDGSGSGAVISTDGYIVTNQHVINDAAEVKVVFPDEGTFDAEIIGEDVLTDLALLKIDRESLPYIPMGDSEELRVGETVLAIGNPLGLFQQTVTGGIISAVGRQVTIPDSEYAYTFIQTDAVINPGNSGGPLVNLRGEIVGINSAKVSRFGVEGIGLSIPSKTVSRVVDDLRNFGQVIRPQVGVLVEDAANVPEISHERGVHIREVVSGSPAEESGVESGDIIVAIDDKDIGYLAQLFDTLLNYYPGDEVTISIIRNGQTVDTVLTLGEM